MEILNKEFWEKRDAAMKRFMASKERKRKRMAELEQMLRQDYLARTGEEPKFVNVWWQGPFKDYEGYIVRIDRDRQLFFDFGGRAVALRGVQKDDFEVVEE